MRKICFLLLGGGCFLPLGCGEADSGSRGGAKPGRLSAHVSVCAFSPDHRYLVLGYGAPKGRRFEGQFEEYLSVWDMKTGNLVRRFSDLQDDICFVEWVGEEPQFVAGTTKGEIGLFHVARGAVWKKRAFKASTLGGTVSFDGKYVAMVGLDKEGPSLILRVWGSTKGDLDKELDDLKTEQPFSGPVDSRRLRTAYCSDGNLGLAVDGVLHIISAKTGKHLRTHKVGQSIAAWSADETRAVCVNIPRETPEPTRIALWDLTTHKETVVFDGNLPEGEVASVMIECLCAGELIAQTSPEGGNYRLTIWETKAGKHTRSLALTRVNPGVPGAVSKDGMYGLGKARARKSYEIWDIKKGEVLWTLDDRDVP